MESSRLKNIIILILLLLNVCLAAVLVGRRADQDATRRQAQEQLSALFASVGITLDDAVIPDRVPLSVRSFTRSLSAEEEVAAFLLGDITSREQSGSSSSYVGTNGAAVFHDNGSFEAAGTLAAQDADAFCRAFCSTFSYRELQVSPNGTSAAAVLYRENSPVWNCTVTFTLDGDTVTGAAGTYLPEKSTEQPSDTALLSASAALSAVLESCRTSGAAISAITEVSLCYEYQSSLTAPMTITPAWKVRTDIDGLCYTVNSLSGAVTVG